MKNKGYGVFIADGSSFYIPDVLHIERIDEEAIFKDDEEACIQAEKDGVKLIVGMENVPDKVYIDTPENRSMIKKQLDLYPEYKFKI